MKKLGKIICFTLLSLLVFTGCSSKQVTIDIDKTASALRNDLTFKDELSQLDSAMLTKVYEIPDGDVVNSRVYISSGATAEEIAVLECKDDNAAENIKKAMEARVDAQKKSFTDYNPEELSKLEKPVIVKKGKYVLLCISDDSDKAQEIIKREIGA